VLEIDLSRPRLAANNSVKICGPASEPSGACCPVPTGNLYVVKMTGAFVDDDRTKTFGHEVLHCFGLRHD
jgi:hypothetical protein